MFPQALRAHSTLGSPPAPPGRRLPDHLPINLWQSLPPRPIQLLPSPHPNYLPTKDTRPFSTPAQRDCCTPLFTPFECTLPCHFQQTHSFRLLETLGTGTGPTAAASRIQTLKQEFKYKALLSRCNFQPYLSSGFFPERKSRKNQRGRHPPLLFLCHAIQENQFRVGSLVLAGAWNAGRFSAVKLFHNLWYKACHFTGHSY